MRGFQLWVTSQNIISKSEQKSIENKTKNISGTNFPPELYDGHLFGKESYYDELRKQQQVEMDKFTKVNIVQGKSGNATFLATKLA